MAEVAWSLAEASTSPSLQLMRALDRDRGGRRAQACSTHEGGSEGGEDPLWRLHDWRESIIEAEILGSNAMLGPGGSDCIRTGLW